MRHPETRKKISVPRHQGREVPVEVPVGALRAILRQVGIMPEEWLKL